MFVQAEDKVVSVSGEHLEAVVPSKGDRVRLKHCPHLHTTEISVWLKNPGLNIFKIKNISVLLALSTKCYVIN